MQTTWLLPISWCSWPIGMLSTCWYPAHSIGRIWELRLHSDILRGGAPPVIKSIPMNLGDILLSTHHVDTTMGALHVSACQRFIRQLPFRPFPTILHTDLSPAQPRCGIPFLCGAFIVYIQPYHLKVQMEKQDYHQRSRGLSNSGSIAPDKLYYSSSALSFSWNLSYLISYFHDFVPFYSNVWFIFADEIRHKGTNSN